MKSRNSILFYINEKRYEVRGEQVLMNLSDFLRYEKSLTGTKVVCAEGDCGACTVLKADVRELSKNRWVFKSVNSCILPLFTLDGSQIVSVEGLQKKTELHPVQTAMVDNFGSQCGYCTPGFICAMASLVEDCVKEKKEVTEKRTKNYLTGNLCRCTGYDPIIKAAMSIDLKKVETLQDRYYNLERVKELKKNVKTSVEIQTSGLQVFLPTTLKQALMLKKKFSQIRIVAGATDLGVAVNKGRLSYEAVMSLQNIEELAEIKKEKKYLVVSSQVNLTQLQKVLKKNFPEMGQMLHLFASPQIKNLGTLIGNVVNASPISDTIPFLMVADALIEVQSSKSKKLIPIDQFFLGYKILNLKKDELVTAIYIPLAQREEISKLYKVSLRKDLDISAVTMAARIKLKGKKIEEARLAFGGVGPVVKRIKEIEEFWIGKELTAKLFSQTSEKIKSYVKPISDVRGSKEYRLLLCVNLIKKMSYEILESK